MNDLLRPSHYSSYHRVEPVEQARGRETMPVDVVGPICESGDFLALDRPIPRVEPGELLAIGTPAPTASPWRPRTTPGRGRRKCWSSGDRHRAGAPARNSRRPRQRRGRTPRMM
jgi:hypothetical protein